MDSYFYRTSLRRIASCTEPDLPEGTPFWWAFYAADLAIIEIPVNVDLPDCPGLERIEGKLEALLASSHKYPPARALAAEALEESQLNDTSSEAGRPGLPATVPSSSRKRAAMA